MISKKKTKMNNIPTIIAFVVIGIVCGFFAGMSLGRRLKESQSVEEALVFLVVFILLLYFVLFIHIIVHEGGHLIFGLLSGYKFVSFRIGSIMLISDNGKFKLKRFKLKGTGGQCLMMPPEVNEEYHYAFTIYNLGGVLINLIIGLVALLLYLTISVDHYLSLFLVLMCIVGIAYTLINGIPMRLGGIANDGYNLMSISKDKESRRAFWLVLQTNALLVEGKRLRDMPAQWFEINQDMDLNNPMVCAIGGLRSSYLQDLKLFDEAKTMCEYMIEDAPGMLELHKNELRCELMFYEIIDLNREEEVEKMYTKELQRYIKITSTFIARKRLMYAYELLVKHNTGEAAKQLAAFKRVAKTYPYQSEIEGENELIELITEKAKHLQEA